MIFEIEIGLLTLGNAMSTSEKQTILLVDDEPSNILLVSTNLSDKYKIKAATSGQKALEIAKKDPEIDLVLLDIMMPEMDGFETCERLKSDPTTAHIPVIFLTGKDSVNDRSKGLSLGARDFIEKPIDMDMLKLWVQEHIRKG